MELEIQEKKENPLLDRTEVTFTVSHPNQPTPRRENVREQLSKELKVPKDTIVIDHMNSKFGLTTSTGYAKIYKKKEAAMQIERKHHLLRNKLVKDEKKKEEPAEAPAEAPAGDEAPPKEKGDEKPEKKEKKDDAKGEAKEEPPAKEDKGDKPDKPAKEDKKEE